MKKNNISNPVSVSMGAHDHIMNKWNRLPSNFMLVHTLTMGNAEGNSLLMQMPAEEALARRDIISCSLIDLADRKSRDSITYAEIVFVLDVPAANILQTNIADASTPDNSFYEGDSVAKKAKLANHFKPAYANHGYGIQTPEHLVSMQNSRHSGYNEVVIVAKEGVILRKDSPATGRIKVKKLLLLPDSDQVSNSKIMDRALLNYWERVKLLNPGVSSDIHLPETGRSFYI